VFSKHRPRHKITSMVLCSSGSKAAPKNFLREFHAPLPAILEIIRGGTAADGVVSLCAEGPISSHTRSGAGCFRDDTIAADSFFAGPPSEPDNKGPSSWSWVNIYFLSFFFRPLFILQLLSRSLLSSQIRKHGKPSTWRRTEVSLQCSWNCTGI
jgi:hypothetical protein